MAGGPLVLMGIDAEDGGVGGHGPIANYEQVVTSILSNVSNGGSGILVIGGGKSLTDDVTTFWNQISTDLGVAVTFVNGAANIASQSFAGFAMIAIVSSFPQTFNGGLTQAENDALAMRRSNIAAFVNNGGGLLGFSQNGFTNPYAYLADVGSFVVNIGLGYSDITPTPAGTAIGITDSLDVCCWHDEYVTFPSFLNVLATNASTTIPSAIGGQQVTIPTGCPIPNPQTCCQVAVEFKTQLVPPALASANVMTEVFFTQPPVIEDVCPEKVIVCGTVAKKITYTAVDEYGRTCPWEICDERPFQCIIDRDDANEGDMFEICGFAVLCEGTPRLQNRGTRPGEGGTGSVDVFWKVIEKDIVKVCIRKDNCNDCQPFQLPCPPQPPR